MLFLSITAALLKEQTLQLHQAIFGSGNHLFHNDDLPFSVYMLSEIEERLWYMVEVAKLDSMKIILLSLNYGTIYETFEFERK